MISNLLELEVDFLSNQCQLDSWRNLSSFECLLSSLPLLRVLVRGSSIVLIDTCRMSMRFVGSERESKCIVLGLRAYIDLLSDPRILGLSQYRYLTRTRLDYISGYPTRPEITRNSQESEDLWSANLN